MSAQVNGNMYQYLRATSAKYVLVKELYKQWNELSL